MESGSIRSRCREGLNLTTDSEPPYSIDMNINLLEYIEYIGIRTTLREVCKINQIEIDEI